MMPENFHEVLELVVDGFEAVGVLVLVLGSLYAVVRAVAEQRRNGDASAYGSARRGIGRAILLGLEFLIIADIVQTITIDLTLHSAAALGLIVLVRTFLSFSLEVELDGVLPWRRGGTEPHEPAQTSGTNR